MREPLAVEGAGLQRGLAAAVADIVALWTLCRLWRNCLFDRTMRWRARITRDKTNAVQVGKVQGRIFPRAVRP